MFVIPIFYIHVITANRFKAIRYNAVRYNGDILYNKDTISSTVLVEGLCKVWLRSDAHLVYYATATEESKTNNSPFWTHQNQYACICDKKDSTHFWWFQSNRKKYQQKWGTTANMHTSYRNGALGPCPRFARFGPIASIPVWCPPRLTPFGSSGAPPPPLVSLSTCMAPLRAADPLKLTLLTY